MLLSGFFFALRRCSLPSGFTPCSPALLSAFQLYSLLSGVALCLSALLFALCLLLSAFCSVVF
jgi:hypothetical protein